MTANPSDKPWRLRTTAIHAGESLDPVTRASSPNLVMSATFAPSEVAGFSVRDESGYDGYVYARLSNPTVRQLETKLAALEAAEAAQCFASGMAASHALLAGRLSAGDHLVISDTNYVGTAELVRDSLPRWGIAVTPVAVSLGHHRSLVTWIDTAALMASTFHLSPDAERRYRAYAGDGIFRLSVGLEDPQDLCTDLDRVL